MGRYKEAGFVTMKGEQTNQTLNREPIEEKFDDLDESSAEGGNNPTTNEHLDALKSA